MDVAEPFDLDLLNEDDPFEIDDQAAHLLKHPHLGIDDVYDVWRSDPLFYLAKPPVPLADGQRSRRAGLGRAARSVGVGRPEHVPTDRVLRRCGAPRGPLPGGPMTEKEKMTREEEYEFYARPENQEPQGPPRRRRSRLTEMVPVRFPPETLAEVRRRAGEDDRSLSSWIRRAVEHELQNTR